MNKAKTRKKINNSIKNKNSTQFIKKHTNKSCLKKISAHAIVFKKNKNIIFDYLEGKIASLPNNLKTSAKTYFLFLLKNSQTHLRHKPPKDPSIQRDVEKYKKFIIKLSS